MTEFLKLTRGGKYLKYAKVNPTFDGNAFLPQRAFVPISLRAGSSMVPIVSRGDFVTDGQVIARSRNSEESDIHAPIPGLIGEFQIFKSLNDLEILTIPIKLEGRFSLLGKRIPNYSWQNTLPSEIIRIIGNAGLVETTNKGISLASQLRQFIYTPKQTLNVSLFDEDPSCGLDDFMIQYFFTQILEGIGIIARALNVKKVNVFHKLKKNQYIDLTEKLSQYCNNQEIQCISVKNTYPFKRSKKNKKSFWLNPSTAMYTYEALVHDRPHISNYILLSGNALKTEKILKVRIGTPIGNLLEECGGLIKKPDYIIINGLIDGYLVDNFDLPISKFIRSIHAISNIDFKPRCINPCDNCGNCIQVCPNGLNPSRIIKHIERNEFSTRLLKELEICTSCNACSTACPSRIQIAKIISKAKNNFNIKGNI